MIYFIVRKNHSGGSIAVALNHNGLPFYTSNPNKRLEFVKKEDAENYMSYCKKNMSNYKGQTDWAIAGEEKGGD